MKSLLLSFMVLISNMAAAAQEFKIFEAEEVYIDAWRTEEYHEPYKPAYNDEWTAGTALNLNLRVMEVYRIDNRIHMDGTAQRLAMAGWEFLLLFDMFSKIQPFYSHHSQHSLDEAGSQPLDTWGFPNKNTIGLRFCAIECRTSGHLD